MNFRIQLIAARKAKGLSQEELAERLNVSRQTIYKWEAGVTYPDIEKLSRLAKQLDVSTSYLLGEEPQSDTSLSPAPNITPEPSLPCPDKAEVLRHYKRFAKMIGACTMLILVSVGVLVLLNGLFTAPWAGALSVGQLLSCIALAVVGYVMAGLRHEAFEKENPTPICFEKEERRRAQRPFALKIVAGLSLIFAGVIFVVIAGFSAQDLLPYIAVASLLALIGAAVYLFITAGILYDLYMGEESPKKYHEKQSEPSEAVCGIIMILATVAFLLLGFIWDLWHPGWVAFPVGGMLCGCVSLIFQACGKGK